MVNPTERTIKCDLCSAEFPLRKDIVREEKVTLTKYGEEPHEVTLTWLQCPRCGKQYPVIMDDESTLPTLAKMRKVMEKQFKIRRSGNNPPPGLEKKRRTLNWKLDFNRRKLAEKYNGSYYQLEDGTITQLDYCYRTQ